MEMREIELQVPGFEGRYEIIQIHAHGGVGSMQLLGSLLCSYDLLCPNRGSFKFPFFQRTFFAFYEKTFWRRDKSPTFFFRLSAILPAA
jgi:hypothetical protein